MLRTSQVHQKQRQPFRLLLHLRQRRRPRQQQHQIGMLNPRNPHFLPVDDVVVASADGNGLGLRRVCAGCRFGDGKRLKPKSSGGDVWQVGALLRVRAVSNERAHHIHLRVARTRVRARSIDLFENDRSFRHTESAAAVLLGNERSEPAGIGQRLYERFGILGPLVERSPVAAVEARTQFTNGTAVIRVLGGPRIDIAHGHLRNPGSSARERQ